MDDQQARDDLIAELRAAAAESHGAQAQAAVTWQGSGCPRCPACRTGAADTGERPQRADRIGPHSRPRAHLQGRLRSHEARGGPHHCSRLVAQ